MGDRSYKTRKMRDPYKLFLSLALHLWFVSLRSQWWGVERENRNDAGPHSCIKSRQLKTGKKTAGIRYFLMIPMSTITNTQKK